ncbi:MAG: hypothetical protein JNN01_25515 [Opitutaceae bacterium]|nr:hypothetical protein [Opitutaceae bacterium]
MNAQATELQSAVGDLRRLVGGSTTPVSEAAPTRHLTPIAAKKVTYKSTQPSRKIGETRKAPMIKSVSQSDPLPVSTPSDDRVVPEHAAEEKFFR